MGGRFKKRTRGCVFSVHLAGVGSRKLLKEYAVGPSSNTGADAKKSRGSKDSGSADRAGIKY